MNNVAKYIKNDKLYNIYGEELVVCELCNDNLTTMIATKRCNPCWELERRVEKSPLLAAKILAKIIKRKQNEGDIDV